MPIDKDGNIKFYVGDKIRWINGSSGTGYSYGVVVSRENDQINSPKIQIKFNDTVNIMEYSEDVLKDLWGKGVVEFTSGRNILKIQTQHNYTLEEIDTYLYDNWKSSDLEILSKVREFKSLRKSITGKERPEFMC